MSSEATEICRKARAVRQIQNMGPIVADLGALVSIAFSRIEDLESRLAQAGLAPEDDFRPGNASGKEENKADDDVENDNACASGPSESGASGVANDSADAAERVPEREEPTQSAPVIDLSKSVVLPPPKDHHSLGEVTASVAAIRRCKAKAASKASAKPKKPVVIAVPDRPDNLAVGPPPSEILVMEASKEEVTDEPEVSQKKSDLPSDSSAPDAAKSLRPADPAPISETSEPDLTTELERVLVERAESMSKHQMALFRSQIRSIVAVRGAQEGRGAGAS